MAQVMIEHVKKRGRIETVASGMENLPTEGGYIMFANHQGKYDALGVMSVHEQPCTFVMDAKRSHLFIVTQLCELLKAKRLDKTDLRQQVQVINDVATEVKAGRRYILFPEGGYDHNHNSLRGFLPGSFKIAQKANARSCRLYYMIHLNHSKENLSERLLHSFIFCHRSHMRHLQI